jgi:pimeloyl-ACP methyl ester carboxylesterase
VLELDANTARGFSAESDRDAPAPTPESLLHDLAGALVALRRDSGAGLVVALGHGLGGEAALLAADGARMAEMLGDAGPRFTALGAIGPGAPAFRAGASPPPDEGWASRVPLLCNVLAVAHLGTPAPGESGSVAAGAVDSACRLGLLVAR